VYFESSNNQKFLTYKKDADFFHEKIENENFILPKNISYLYCNFKYPKFLNNELNCKSFKMSETVLKNINNLEFTKSLIIKPIYVSNNIILN
jgi:hypothetical protein